jgi:hypothetical protein
VGLYALARRIVPSLLPLLLSGTLLADEGMYPISDLGRINFARAGLTVTAADIYAPGGAGLSDAIVNLSGCTGSFVSSDGLILTNHHCVFGYVQGASSVEHDYVTEGFLARTRAEEIPAKGATVRITESSRDVSAEVLSALSDTMSPGERTRAVTAKTRSLAREAEKANPGKSAEVAEMFAGKSYVLFLYKTLRDVRLVYVPPRSIGDFGGEDDNWVWPRHTGDFSFLRVYVAPGGTPAEYARENIPYHPRRFLKVQAAGVDEEDPVFILGYPGRTFRHRTSHYLAFEQNVRMPYVAGLYEWEIATMLEQGKGDRAVALKHDARIKGLANTSKNYRGKMKGVARLGLIGRKEEEERRLQEWILADPVRAERYGTVLERTAEVYREMSATAQRDLALDALRSSSTLLSVATSMLDMARERAKPDDTREQQFRERNLSRTLEGLRISVKNYHQPTERLFLRELLTRLSGLPEELRVVEFDSLLGGDRSPEAVEALIGRLLATSLEEPAILERFLGEDSLRIPEDPAIDFARALATAYAELRSLRQEREGKLAPLSALFVDAKAEYLKKDFIPDANGTLRFTYGRIRGFAPADAVRYEPITTLKGVVEKTTGTEPYASPQKLLELYRKKDFGRYAHKRLKSIPVGLLYNLDTTGGNSGSPLLNAAGEMVGINFDRAFEATINDFAWSEEYSRSIAVDIRYVLWVTEKIGGATDLIREMEGK